MKLDLRLATQLFYRAENFDFVENYENVYKGKEKRTVKVVL